MENLPAAEQDEQRRKEQRREGSQSINCNYLQVLARARLILQSFVPYPLNPYSKLQHRPILSNAPQNNSKRMQSPVVPSTVLVPQTRDAVRVCVRTTSLRKKEATLKHIENVTGQVGQSADPFLL